MATFAVLTTASGLLSVVDAEDGEVWPARFVGDQLESQTANAEAALLRSGWRKDGHWAHRRSDGNRQWVAVERIGLDLVGTAEIARAAGVKPATVQAWTERHATFPAPVQTFGATRVWRWGDVAEWLAIPRKPGRPRRG
jgi:hypothetical protein